MPKEGKVKRFFAISLAFAIVVLAILAPVSGSIPTASAGDTFTSTPTATPTAVPAYWTPTTTVAPTLAAKPWRPYMLYEWNEHSGTMEYRAGAGTGISFVGHGKQIIDRSGSGIQGTEVLFITGPNNMLVLVITDGAWAILSSQYASQEFCAQYQELQNQGKSPQVIIDQVGLGSDPCGLTPTSTSTQTATNTSIPTATPTPTLTATSTPSPTATSTLVSTSTPTPQPLITNVREEGSQTIIEGTNLINVSLESGEHRVFVTVRKADGGIEGWVVVIYPWPLGTVWENNRISFPRLLPPTGELVVIANGVHSTIFPYTFVTVIPTPTSTSTSTPSPTPAPRITGLGIRLFDDKRTVTIDGDGFLLNPALERYVQTTDNNGGYWNMGSPMAGGEWTATRITFTLPVDFAWKTVSMRVVVGETRSNWVTISVPEPTATSTPTPTNEVKDVRVSNVTDESFTVSFLTNSPALPALAIWESGMTTTQLVKDFRTAPGETHWYQVVGGLKPTTLYQYAIYWGGMTVHQGVVQTKAKGSINTPRIAFGQVTDQIGHPVYGALVYLTEDSNGLLSAVSDQNGWWSADLNSAQPTTETVHALGGGPTPLIHIKATAGSLGSAIATVPSDFRWPLSLNLRSVVTRSITLGEGWNSFSLPLEPVGIEKISDLANVINAGRTTRLASVYEYGPNGWRGSVIIGTNVLGENFSLEMSRGYFFETNEALSWNLQGFTVTQVIPLYLRSGWNLVGIPNPSGLTASDLSDVTGVISGTTTYNVHEVDRWVYGRYQGHVAGYPFNNFSIDPDRAYFLRVNRAGRLDPGAGFVPLP